MVTDEVLLCFPLLFPFPFPFLLPLGVELEFRDCELLRRGFLVVELWECLLVLLVLLFREPVDDAIVERDLFRLEGREPLLEGREPLLELFLRCEPWRPACF